MDHTTRPIILDASKLMVSFTSLQGWLIGWAVLVPACLFLFWFFGGFGLAFVHNLLGITLVPESLSTETWLGFTPWVGVLVASALFCANLFYDTRRVDAFGVSVSEVRTKLKRLHAESTATGFWAALNYAGLVLGIIVLRPFEGIFYGAISTSDSATDPNLNFDLSALELAALGFLGLNGLRLTVRPSAGVMWAVRMALIPVALGLIFTGFYAGNFQNGYTYLAWPTAFAILFGPRVLFRKQIAAGWTRNATDVMRERTHGPIVFLRSFEDEDVQWIEDKNGQTPRKTRIEQLVRDCAQLYAPFVAIGAPGSPRAGAARAYYDDADWQEVVTRWIESASTIIVVAGRTSGLEWELNTIVTRGCADKLLFLLPPSGSRDRTRWAMISRSFGVDLSLPSVADIFAVCRLSSGEPLFVRIDENFGSVQTAINLAIYGMHFA